MIYIYVSLTLWWDWQCWRYRCFLKELDEISEAETHELLVKGYLNVCGHYSFSLLFSEQAYNHGCMNHWSHSGEQLRCHSKALWFCAQTHGGIKCEVWFLLFLVWLTTNSSSYTIGENNAHKWQYLRALFFLNQVLTEAVKPLGKETKVEILGYVGGCTLTL